MINKLFVYGTLGPNRPNEYVMNNIGGTWEKGSIKGKLYNQGWGAEMGFPGIVLDDNADRVDGFVFTSDNFSKHWSDLDQFEGSAYVRVETTAEIENGMFVKTYVYCLKS